MVCKLMLCDILIIGAMLVLGAVKRGVLSTGGVSARLFGISFAGGVSAVFLSGVASWFLSNFLPDFMEGTFFDMQQSLIGLLAIVVLGPLTEELLFREVAVRALSNHYGACKVVFYSALIFSVFHLNPAQMPQAFLVGLLLGWMRVCLGTILPGLFVHMANNGISCYIDWRYPGVDTLWEALGLPCFFAVAIIAILLFSYAIYYVGRATR